MFNLLYTTAKGIRIIPRCMRQFTQSRTLLSQAYYCNEVWEQRFGDPILQRVNLDELYNELDQKYQKMKNMSAVDVDVFSNAVKDELYSEELLDLIHKLRMSADTCNTLSSTPHAVIRSLINFGKTDQLLSVLDDRLNYGLFLDNYTANLLFDIFWENKDYQSGARIAGQLMLQEDFDHPLCINFSLLHCYNFLLNPNEWPQPAKPDEPEEEVKIRINYLRNPYDDDHFDLRDPLKILGKTLIIITKGSNDVLEKSFHLLGLALFERYAEAEDFIQRLDRNEKIYEDVLKLIPEGNDVKEMCKTLQLESADVQALLQERVKASIAATAEKDVADQCENYSKWEVQRKEALEKQHQRLLTARRLADIEETQKSLKEKETLLWYFENEERIELEIEEKKANLTEKGQKKRTVVKTDDNYVPPEVQKKLSSN